MRIRPRSTSCLPTSKSSWITSSTLSFLAGSVSPSACGGALPFTGVCFGTAGAAAILATAAVAAASSRAAAGAFGASCAARSLMLIILNEPRIEAARATAVSPTLAVTIVPPSRTPAR